MKKFYEYVLAKLRELPEEKRMLISGNMRSFTSDTKVKCGCVIGVVTPDSVYDVVGNGYISPFGDAPVVRAWLEEAGVVVPEGVRFPETDEAGSIMALQNVNDVFGPTRGMDNDEASCRLRYAHVVGYLERTIALYEAEAP